jgi:glutamine synthetase
MDTKEIIERIKSHKIEIVRLWFTDVLGQLKGFNISVSELERALSEGIGFDGSSVEGFVRIEESDLLAKPDPNSLFILSGEWGGIPTAGFICDILYPDGSPFESDPRFVLKKALEKAGEYTYYVGPELEYFYFPGDKEPTPLDQGGYFDVLPIDEAAKARKETIVTLNNMGIEVEASHHEVATSQHEIDFKYKDALKMADQLQITKTIIKQKARKYGLYATFMPKPIFGINGSGLHVHQSLFKGDVNVFYDPDDPYNLSPIAKGFIAGLLTHSREITAVTNQWVNSYKRLVVGYEAPVYISWGRKNRSALVRVPAFKPQRPNSCRAEYRAPDPACNPYLAFAVMLGAGLKGVEGNYPLPDPIEEDIYAMPEEVKRTYGIDALPDSLYAAVLEMEKSELVKEIFGEELFTKYVRNKKSEWESYRIRVTDYEIRHYLPRL